MARSRRLPKWLFAAALPVAGAVLFTVTYVKRDRYAFLDELHPKRTYLDIDRLATPASRTLPRVREYVLEFPEQDAERVLTALKTNLSPAKGYDVRDFGAGVRFFPDSKHDQVVTFERAPTPPVKWITESVEFQTGRSATYERMRLIETVRAGRSVSIPKDQVGSGTCIVVVTSESSWLQDQLDRLRDLLHI